MWEAFCMFSCIIRGISLVGSLSCLLVESPVTFYPNRQNRFWKTADRILSHGTSACRRFPPRIIVLHQSMRLPITVKSQCFPAYRICTAWSPCKYNSFPAPTLPKSFPILSKEFDIVSASRILPNSHHDSGPHKRRDIPTQDTFSHRQHKARDIPS